MPIEAEEPISTLWQIGEADNDTSDLAHGPKDFRWIQRGGFFVVGYSEGNSDWPYAHPGPVDAWAPDAARTFSIYFGLKEAPTANCRLILDLVDTHPERPPTLRVSVNRHHSDHPLPRGGSHGSIFGNPEAGREHRLVIEIPAKWLKAGLNEIRILNREMSWILYDTVVFQASDSTELAPAEGIMLRTVELDPWLTRLDGKPGHQLAVTLVRVGPPTEVTIEATGSKPFRLTARPGVGRARLRLPPFEKETDIAVEVRQDERLVGRRAMKVGPSRQREPVDWVDPMLGTSSSRWMLFPGPSMPFGMVKLSPDNEDRPGTWYKGGHEYLIENIAGFSHIHSWTLGGLLTVPTTGPLQVKPGPQDEPDKGYRSRYRHETEKATPGYYAVTLDDYDIRAELTCTTRCGVQRYTYPKSEHARILFDLAIPTEYYVDILGAEIRQVGPNEIEGYSTQRCLYAGHGADVYTVHFVAQLSKPIARFGGWVGDKVHQDVQRVRCGGDDPKIDIGGFVEFDTEKGEQVTLQTGISFVSIEQARLNLQAEMKPSGGDFDVVHRHARQTWNRLLSLIQVEGGSPEEKIKFYTNLYRSYCARTIFSDVNGKYVDMYERVQQLSNPNSPMLGCDAFWNTFWNLNQLWILITPDVAGQWVRALLEIDRVGGWLPKGPAGVEYSSIMVASHEIPLIVAAYQQGVRDFDVEHAWRAIEHIQTTPGGKHEGGGEVGNENIEAYMELGYVPVEDGRVSNTVEIAYDDWCAAQLAKALGKESAYKTFMKRSENWRNVFDPETKYIRPRHCDGRWLDPFDPFSPKNYVEGNAWQYTWFVPQNLPGLIEAMGREEFNQRLEHGFEQAQPTFTSRYVEHGNQPNMQAAWLFNFSGKPWLTQYWVRQILRGYYGLGPVDGYPGDEDQGQMGAWYVLSAMGLFQMDGGCAVEPSFSLASPIFDKITLQLDPKYYPGKQLIIRTLNNGPENYYIQSASFNGEPVNEPSIAQAKLVGGGELVFELGPEPNRNWGTKLAR